jgi:hypothetical protein
MITHPETKKASMPQDILDSVINPLSEYFTEVLPHARSSEISPKALMSDFFEYLEELDTTSFNFTRAIEGGRSRPFFDFEAVSRSVSLLSPNDSLDLLQLTLSALHDARFWFEGGGEDSSLTLHQASLLFTIARGTLETLTNWENRKEVNSLLKDKGRDLSVSKVQSSELSKRIEAASQLVNHDSEARLSSSEGWTYLTSNALWIESKVRNLHFWSTHSYIFEGY